MIYLFERENEALRVETRFTKISNLYEIIRRHGDGTVMREGWKI